MMNLFKLFKNEEKGKSMQKAPEVDPKKNESTLIWNRFWGAYDYVMESAAFRQSVNFPLQRDHYIVADEMFAESLEDLRDACQRLLDDREAFSKSKEADAKK